MKTYPCVTSLSDCIILMAGCYFDDFHPFVRLLGGGGGGVGWGSPVRVSKLDVM